MIAKPRTWTADDVQADLARVKAWAGRRGPKAEVMALEAALDAGDLPTANAIYDRWHDRMTIDADESRRAAAAANGGLVDPADMVAAAERARLSGPEGARAREALRNTTPEDHQAALRSML